MKNFYFILLVISLIPWVSYGGTLELKQKGSKIELKDGGKTAGYIQWSDCYISEVYVQKEYRKQKLGAKLMQAALDELSHCKVVELTADPMDPTEVSIKALLRFYKGFGFTPSLSDRIKIKLGKIPTHPYPDDDKPAVRLYKTMPKRGSVSTRPNKNLKDQSGSSESDTSSYSKSSAGSAE